MKLIFAGTPPNAAQALEALGQHHEIALVITREDAPVGRKRELRASAVAETATALGLPVLKRNRLGADDIDAIRNSGAERAIVVAYGALIPQSILDVLPWWNLHFSLLPNWRGATPLQHSMLSGGKGAGITLFELEAGLDTGPIIASQPKQIDYSRTCGELLGEFTTSGTNLILQSLADDRAPEPQKGEASLAPKISREEARLSLADTADQIGWKVMALNPEPTAWVELDGQPLRVLRAVSLGSTDWNALDGQRGSIGELTLRAGKVLLHCGEGTQLELLEVQPAGKKAMPAVDWFRGLNKEIRLD